MVKLFVAHAVAWSIFAIGPTSANAAPGEPGAQDLPRRTQDDGATRVGRGLVLGGGVTMAIGTGVLLPVSMRMLLKTPAPDPDDYVSAEAFTRDVDIYRDHLDRATDLAVAGAVVGAVGAATFVTGAIVWGVGRRRTRTQSWGANPRAFAVAFGGDRRSFTATARWRF